MVNSQGKETAQSGRVNRAHPTQLFVPQSAWPGLASSSHTTKFMNLENPPSDALESYGNAHQHTYIHTYIHTTGRTSDVRSCLRVFAIHVERVVGVCMHICVCRRLDRYARRVLGLAGCGPRLGKGGETVCDDAASTPRVWIDWTGTGRVRTVERTYLVAYKRTLQQIRTYTYIHTHTQHTSRSRHYPSHLPINRFNLKEGTRTVTVQPPSL
jgi:hypothetical protein